MDRLVQNVNWVRCHFYRPGDRVDRHCSCGLRRRAAAGQRDLRLVGSLEDEANDETENPLRARCGRRPAAGAQHLDHLTKLPDEAFQGVIFRIIFFHVPCAFTCFLCFFMALIASHRLPLHQKPEVGRARRCGHRSRARFWRGQPGHRLIWGTQSSGASGGPGTRASPPCSSAGCSTPATWCCATPSRNRPARAPGRRDFDLRFRSCPSSSSRSSGGAPSIRSPCSMAEGAWIPPIASCSTSTGCRF